jgi:dTDP-4-amino-4,6-dideoxygalactose transaminase
MWVRKRLDIGWLDLAAAAAYSLVPWPQTDCEAMAEQAWPDPGEAFATLSVRSGFDLLLDALELPAQSEILISAFTIPDMVRIIAAHDLVPVPVDLSLDTMGPDPASLRRAITPQSRVLVTAHLLGGRFPMPPILEIAKEHRLLLVEDCAQAFDGGRFIGHPNADVSMFSFGSIKTATALGGAILRVRDAQLLASLRLRSTQRPLQPRAAFFARLAKYSVLKAMSSRPVFGAIVHGCAAFGQPYDRFVNGTVRGFAGSNFFERIRRRPSAPLLALLRRRLRGYDRQRVAIRARRGHLLTKLLSDHVVWPGRSMESPTYWVFPIVVENPNEVILALRQAGFDATQGQSMCAVPPPPNRPELTPYVASHLLEKSVYLPIYSAMTESAVRKMADVVCRVARRPAFVDELPTRGVRPDDGSEAESLASQQ